MIKMILTKKYKNGEKEYIYPKTSSDLVLLGNNKSLSDKLNEFDSVNNIIKNIDINELSRLNTVLYNLIHNSNEETSPKTISQNIKDMVQLISYISQGIYDSGTDIPDGDLYLDNYVQLIDEIRQPLVQSLVEDRTTLTRITIPEEVTNIANEAFYGCSNLEEVYIPDTVISLGISSFEGCSKLKTVRFSNNITYIPESCFEYSGIEECILPEGLTYVGYGAFWSCSRMNKLILPESLTSISMWAFDGCSSLTEITIPNNVTSIGLTGFCSCSNLEKVNIDIENSKLSYIGEQAFDYTYKLKTFPFPKSISSLARHCFSSSGLEELIFPDTDHNISIGGNCFGGCKNLKKMYLSANVILNADIYDANSYETFRSATQLEDVTLGNGFNSNFLDLSASNKYPREMIVSWLNALYNRTGIVAYNNVIYKLIIGEENLAKLTDQDKAIAYDKNWTLA